MNNSFDAAASLRARGLRVTPQRTAILGVFTDRADEHLAADEVHARASAALSNISRGTVYAALAELTEIGLLSAFGTAEPVRFETNITAHDHFRCRLCLRLFDVDLETPDTSQLSLDGFVVESVGSVVDGVCADCTRFADGVARGAADIIERPVLAAETVRQLVCHHHDTALGPIALAASHDGVVRVSFEDHADFGALVRQAEAGVQDDAAQDNCEAACRAIDDYLEHGVTAAATNIVDWPLAECVSPASMEATRHIPYGTHRSYEQMGLEDSVFDAGYAIGANPMPMLLPCHRVRRGSVLADSWVGGPDRRRELLSLEGAF